MLHPLIARFEQNKYKNYFLLRFLSKTIAFYRGPKHDFLIRPLKEHILIRGLKQKLKKIHQP